MAKNDKFSIRVQATQGKEGLDVVVDTVPLLVQKPADEQDSFELLQTMIFESVKIHMDGLMAKLGQDLAEDEVKESKIILP